jgi:hypothetical protein
MSVEATSVAAGGPKEKQPTTPTGAPGAPAWLRPKAALGEVTRVFAQGSRAKWCRRGHRACGRCLIDNTHVVVLSGTGKLMLPAPEMAAFAERFGFRFAAHQVGDANRSGRVEAPMSFIENNFLAGRSFESFVHANQQALKWCDQVNARFVRRWHASRRELFQTEQPRLRPLPLWVPPVYEIHSRIVDAEGYVNLHRQRYSVPYLLIGRPLEVRESKHQVEAYDGPRKVASHLRLVDTQDRCSPRLTLATEPLDGQWPRLRRGSQEHTPDRPHGVNPRP